MGRITNGKRVCNICHKQCKLGSYFRSGHKFVHTKCQFRVKNMEAKMKRLQVKISIIYALEVPDDFNYKEPENVQNSLVKYLQDNNMTAHNEFFENITVVCSECGISLSLDEEEQDGKCVQCDAK